MEILYLYFKSDILPFGNQDINFGGKFRFHYNEKDREFIASKNPFYVENFFSINKPSDKFADVLNVTSVIGENGTGKTSLLKTISQSLAEGQGGLQHHLILVLANAGNIMVYHMSDIAIKKHNLSGLSISIEKLSTKIEKLKLSNGKEYENQILPKIDAFRDTDFIYFSNIYDASFENDIQVKGTCDISTNFLVRNDFVKNVENGRINREVSNPIDIHQFEEKERQIAFINRYKHKEYIPFELPRNIYLSIKRSINFDSGYPEIYKKIIDEYGFLNDFRILSIELEALLSKSKKKDYFIDLFTSSCLMNLLLELATSYRSTTSSGKFEIDTELIKKNKGIRSIALAVLEHLKVQSDLFSVKLDGSHYIWIEGALDFINSLPDLISSTNSTSGENQVSLAWAINDKTGPDFEKLYNSYRNSYRLKPYLNFAWRGLSSGENALLNIYSRFHSLSNEEQINELNKNVIILIDEGDVYLHPSWQKRFVNILLNFLPRLFAKTRNGVKRNIQIVLTTNSPIPASDLPNDNTVFLERNVLYTGIYGSKESKSIVKDSLNDQRETFAANIYTLLSDSFFIKDGLIGDFASLKINEIITELTKGATPSKERREEIRNIIHQIGEPILKHKLMQLYNDRFNLEIHERLDKIESKLSL